jgi:hypothetical protein
LAWVKFSGDAEIQTISLGGATMPNKLNRGADFKFGFGLVLFIFHQSVMIEPVSARSLLAGTGGGWIVLGLVLRDRF